MSDVVEVVQFRIAKGVDEPAFLRASDAAQDFLTRARGFIGRELIRTPDGLNWINIIRWRSRSDAEDAARSGMKDPRFSGFYKMIEKSSIKMAQMEQARLYH